MRVAIFVVALVGVGSITAFGKGVEIVKPEFESRPPICPYLPCPDGQFCDLETNTCTDVDPCEGIECVEASDEICLGGVCIPDPCVEVDCTEPETCVPIALEEAVCLCGTLPACTEPEECVANGETLQCECGVDGVCDENEICVAGADLDPATCQQDGGGK